MTRETTPLDALSEQWLDTLLELQPELHVHLGRPGREGEYSDLSPDGHAQLAEAGAAVLRQARDLQPQDDVDVVTRAELLRTLELAADQHELGLWQRDLNVIASPVQDLRDIFDLTPMDSQDDWSVVALRLGNLPAALAGYVESLRAGVRAGNAPAVRQVREVAAQARKLTGDRTFFTDLAAQGRAAGVPDSLAAALDAGAAGAAEAYADLVEVLLEEVAPHAPEADGVGREIYAVASRGFIGSGIDLDETYAWGVEELARMVAEQEAVAREVLPGATVAEAIAHLETDPTRRLHGTDALQAWMQTVSDQAVEELGRTHFDIPDRMRRLECRIAPTQEGGIYYTGPSEDFSRPGRMWWSVPEGETEFDTWRELTTVYHEGVPGHHLQIGLATHHSDLLNGWRRTIWNSGHGEGWALYAERLMADLGYLDDPADRLGMLDGQRMRAARVVLDLGVHLGLEKPADAGIGTGPWTGDDAFAFMPQHVNMSDAFVRFEVNRYLGWPGQAPSYKVGQRLWEDLRDDWVAVHGDDLKTFHRDALRLGTAGMATIRSALLPGG